MSKRGDGDAYVRDCGMKLTMDGKLSRKEVRKRRDEEREKRRKKLPKGK